MSIKNYGVLKGKPVKSDPGSNKSPHYQVLIQDDQGINYRIAINIQSEAYPSEVLYLVSENLPEKEITQLPAISSGFTSLANQKPPLGLDFIRGHLFNPADMVPLPAEKTGPDNDLNEKIQKYIQQAITEEASVYAFGSKWGPENGKKDQYFGFLPGNGIHDIHMNQGNSGKWERDNGVWQDGGILIHFEKEQKWVGIFLAFQSQSWCTNEQGNPVKPVSQCDHTNFKNQQ